MKILYIQWESVGRKDLEEAFIQEGHSLLHVPLSPDELYYGEYKQIEKRLSQAMGGQADIIFSVNYYPAITEFCSKRKMRYVSWIYDYPYDWMYFGPIVNQCNIVYIFDKEICQEFCNAGISTVRYLPMAANVQRLDRITNDLPFKYDISFVGNLYLGKEQFSQRASLLTDHTRGYIDGLVAAQMKISGYNFIPEVLGPILEEMCKVYPRYPLAGDLRSDEFVVSENIINPWISAVERMDLLEAVAKDYGVEFFTGDRDFVRPNLRNQGPVEYYDKMPAVFKQSRINLNISLRGMRSAVPLRCFDIMGSGGFLLSNFQSGFLDMFVPGEDFVFYESKEDLLQKIEYYLAHEQERQAIAGNGYKKVARAHTYRHRVREMLDF